MTIKVEYGVPGDMELDINDTRVTISVFKIKQESLVQLANRDEGVELVFTQFTDENDKLVYPDMVDVKDPDLVLMSFTEKFTGTATVVTCWDGAIEKLNTSVISTVPIVKQPNKVWIDLNKRRPYVSRVVEVKGGDESD